MTAYFDALETRAPAEREAALMAALPAQVAHAQAHAPAFAELLAASMPRRSRSRAALARLPVTRKHELLERQKAHARAPIRSAASRPSAGARCARRAARCGCSSRPARSTNPKAQRADYWRMARALFAAGFRAGDLVHNSFSYHLTPGRLDDGNRRPRARLHRVPGRRRQDRTAAAGDGRTGAGRLRRHAELPEASCSRRRPRLGVALPSLTQGAGRRRGLPAGAARLAARARHRGLPELRHGRPGPDRLRDRGARRPGARRRRDRRDRAPRHRRPGARRRGRRGGRHHAEPRLPADPLRHRRPVGACCRAPARPAAPTPASRAGWAAPTRPPRCAACSCTRRRWPRSRGATPRSRKARLVVSGEMANDRMTLQVEARGGAAGLAERMAQSDARRDQAARRGGAARARQPAQRRQGDRGRAALRVT